MDGRDYKRRCRDLKHKTLIVDGGDRVTLACTLQVLCRATDTLEDSFGFGSKLHYTASSTLLAPSADRGYVLSATLALRKPSSQ